MVIKLRKELNMSSKKESILYETWKEMINIIPKMRKAVKTGMIRDQKLFIHDIQRVQMERKLIKKALEFFHGKWTLDIIYTIVNMKQPYYNEIKKTLANVNSRTLTTRLKNLQKEKIIKRHIEKGQPVRVYYTITEFGMGIFEMILPFIFYFILPKELRG